MCGEGRRVCDRATEAVDHDHRVGGVGENVGLVRRGIDRERERHLTDRDVPYPTGRAVEDGDGGAILIYDVGFVRAAVHSHSPGMFASGYRGWGISSAVDDR